MFEAGLSLSGQPQRLATKPGSGRVFRSFPSPKQRPHRLFFTPILRLPNPALWRLYAGYSYHLVVNYTNGVDMNWLYLLLVLALAGYLLRALARTHE
ncbi:hypothetical protein [Aeromonas enteropelogenes]|uniref:hypothetical protein n=1 Tax=Aeromonas enteropelogenes TaxID=29489 RepID=UPI003F745CAD